MDRTKLATGTGAALAVAMTGAVVAAGIRRHSQHLAKEYSQHVERVREYIVEVMTDPDRTIEAEHIKAILFSLGLPADGDLGIPDGQVLALRLQTLSGGMPSRRSLRLITRFLKKYQLAGIPVAQLALDVAAAIAYTMVHGEPPPADQIQIIDELDRRLGTALVDPPPTLSAEALRHLLDRLVPGVLMVGGGSRGSQLRAQLRTLRQAELTPDTAAVFEAAMLDLAGAAGAADV